VVGIGIFFYLWFLGSLRSTLAAAEGGAGRLASVAYGAGLVGAAFFIVGLAAERRRPFGRTRSIPVSPEPSATSSSSSGPRRNDFRGFLHRNRAGRVSARCLPGLGVRLSALAPSVLCPRSAPP